MEFGVQLFSLRKYGKTTNGVRELFENVSKLGAKYVQYSGLCEIEAKELDKIAKDNGIEIVCTHKPFDKIKNDIDKLAEQHLTFGCHTIGLGMMPKQYRKNNFERINEFIDIMNERVENLKKYNIELAYHNHHIEFKKYKEELVYDKLIKEMNTQYILDTFWINFAGYSNEDYIKKLQGRIKNIHLKDGKRIFGNPVFLDLGKGIVDFPKLLPLFEEAGTQYCLYEKDLSLNAYKSLKNSWDYINSI